MEFIVKDPLYRVTFFMYTNKLSIKCWAEEDRPREKLLLKGKQSLSDAELLAILIGSGNRELSAVGLCKLLLSDTNYNLNMLAKLQVQDLTKYKGVGEAKAISIIAALELGKRRQISAFPKVDKITCSKDAYQLLRHPMEEQEVETFYILLMNKANKVISKQQISKGGIGSTVVDKKIIFSKALEVKASAIILSHNHPSGNLKPSEQDKQITKQLVAAGKIMDILILDHLIIGQNNYLSFGDEGLL